MTTITEITGLFLSKEEVLAVLPFYFNESNSDITVAFFVDGLVTVTVSFGKGKGWDTLTKDLVRETEFSHQAGLLM